MEEVREAVVDSVSYSEPRAESAPISLAASSVETSAVEGSDEASWAARGAEVAVVSAMVGASVGSAGSADGAGLGELMTGGYSKGDDESSDQSD